eukprot:COSAG02_NODE_47586_length_340_cov_0.647303_1_plen_48_part_00
MRASGHSQLERDNERVVIGTWGEDGYIRIERGVGASGIAQEAATIVV